MLDACGAHAQSVTRALGTSRLRGHQDAQNECHPERVAASNNRNLRSARTALVKFQIGRFGRKVKCRLAKRAEQQALDPRGRSYWLRFLLKFVSAAATVQMLAMLLPRRYLSMIEDEDEIYWP